MHNRYYAGIKLSVAWQGEFNFQKLEIQQGEVDSCKE